MQSAFHVQRRLVPESELADSHSRFRTIEGIKVHYRVEHPPQGASAKASSVAAVHCYHGFGANTFSWSFTQVGHLLACFVHMQHWAVVCIQYCW
jgi:hypothetical protein